MMLPMKSLSQIAETLIRLYADYGKMNNMDWETFCLNCRAWEERTGDPVTFAEMKDIQRVYGD